MLICDAEALRIFYGFTLRNYFFIIISHLYLQSCSYVMGICKCWERPYTETRLCALKIQKYHEEWISGRTERSVQCGVKYGEQLTEPVATQRGLLFFIVAADSMVRVKFRAQFILFYFVFHFKVIFRWKRDNKHLVIYIYIFIYLFISGCPSTSTILFNAKLHNTLRPT
jgi:hypothetical protein